MIMIEILISLVFTISLPIDIVYPRASHASCLYNNSIYIIGGRNSSDSSIVNSVEIDLMSNISMTFDPIYTQLQANSQSFACSLDGEIYYSAFGKDAFISDDIMMYDVVTGNEMFLFKGTVRQPCVAYNSEYNVLYIIGGSDDIQLEMASNVVMECELFNYTCVQMSRLIEARVEHTCQYVNNKLYAIMGTSSSIEYLNDASGNSSWNILAEMTYPQPITGMRSILVEELIYIIGGENIAGFIGSVLIIDTVNDALISSSINLEIPRTRHSMIYDPDTQLIYVIGGFNGEYLKSAETIKNGSTVITTTEAPNMDKNNTGYIAGLIVGLVSPLVCGLAFLWIYQNYLNSKRYVSDSTTDESKKLTNQP